MKPQRKKQQGKTELPLGDIRHNPEFISWHRDNFSPAEHADFLAGGVLPPLSEAVNHQPNDQTE
jgi:hypothetical protein